MTNLFQQQALDRKRNRAGKNNAISLINTPLKICIYTSIFVSLSLLIWSIVAKIPLRANGIGILLPNQELRPIKSTIEGKVVFFFQDGKLNSPSYDNMLFDFLLSSGKPITDNTLFTITDNLKDVRSKFFSAKKNFNTFDFPKTVVPKGSIIAVIKPSKKESLDLETVISDYKNLLKFNLKSIDAETIVYNSTTKIFDAKSEILKKMKKLQDTKFVSENSILNYQSELNQTKNKVQSSRLNIDSKYDEITKARNHLVSTVRQVLRNSIVFSEQDQYILEMNTSNYSFHTPGDTLMTVSLNPLSEPVTIPVFFPNSQAGKVSSGMKTLVTPKGLSRAAVGGIKGEIKSMERLPSSSEYIKSVTGLISAAELIEAQVKDPTVGSLKLFKSQKPPYTYQWSSGEPPDIQSLKGGVLEVEVTTGYTRPIALVIPFLREFFGVVPPEIKNSPKVKFSNKSRS